MGLEILSDYSVAAEFYARSVGRVFGQLVHPILPAFLLFGLLGPPLACLDVRSLSSAASLVIRTSLSLRLTGVQRAHLGQHGGSVSFTVFVIGEVFSFVSHSQGLRRTVQVGAFTLGSLVLELEIGSSVC